MRIDYLNDAVFTYYENEDENEGEKDNNVQTFTPEQVEAMRKEDQAKFQKERSNMVQQLEEIQKTSSLNEQQKKELEDQVTALREASMTSEERAKAALERKEQDYNDKLSNLEKERNEWQGKYTKTRINNSLLSAANGNEAKPFHSEDIVNALGANTFLKELTDDLGKKTGEFDVVVKFNDIDEDGKKVVVEIDPGQAVNKMSKMPRWSHLFKSNKISGSGGSASTDTEEIDLGKLAAENPKQFLELTQKHPELLDKI